MFDAAAVPVTARFSREPEDRDELLIVKALPVVTPLKVNSVVFPAIARLKFPVGAVRAFQRTPNPAGSVQVIAVPPPPPLVNR